MRNVKGKEKKKKGGKETKSSESARLIIRFSCRLRDATLSSGRALFWKMPFSPVLQIVTSPGEGVRGGGGTSENRVPRATYRGRVRTMKNCGIASAFPPRVESPSANTNERLALECHPGLNLFALRWSLRDVDILIKKPFWCAFSFSFVFFLPKRGLSLAVIDMVKWQHNLTFTLSRNQSLLSVSLFFQRSC